MKRQNIDVIWLMFLLLFGSALSISIATTLFDLTVFLSGILCVGLIAVGRREGYLLGLYNSLAYAILAYGNGLYGEVYLNLLFFVPTGVIGFFIWRRHTRSEEHTSELQSRENLVCRLLLEKKKKRTDDKVRD